MDILAQTFREGLFLCHALVPNWGLAIVSFTAFIRLAILPLQLISMREQRLVKNLKPKLDELQERLKSEPLRLLEERRALLKSEGSRAGLSALATLAPIPVFFSMYRVISTMLPLTAAAFAWISNLAAPDPLFILPIASAALVWLQSRGTAAAAGPVAYLIPLVSLGVLAFLPAGLGLYSVTGSAIQFVAQRQMEKRAK